MFRNKLRLHGHFSLTWDMIMMVNTPWQADLRHERLWSDMLRGHFGSTSTWDMRIVVVVCQNYCIVWASWEGLLCPEIWPICYILQWGAGRGQSGGIWSSGESCSWSGDPSSSLQLQSIPGDTNNGELSLSTIEINFIKQSDAVTKLVIG